MCLQANQQLREGDPAPTRIRAWKIVNPDRSPFYMASLVERYFDGTVHTVSRLIIENGSSRLGSYNEGLHVFTDLNVAETDARSWSTFPAMLLEVEVSPDDWIAEDTRCCEAVYCRIKIIGEVDFK